MSLEFYNDFFGSTIMNHCEFLKTLPELGKDDIDLLKSIIGNLSENTEKQQITPFYPKHKNLRKNIVCILESYDCVKKLKAHELIFLNMLF